MNYPMQWNMLQPQQQQNPWDFNWGNIMANPGQAQGIQNYQPIPQPDLFQAPNMMQPGQSVGDKLTPNPNVMDALQNNMNFVQQQGQGTPFNWNNALQNFGTAAQGLSSIGNMWTGLKGLDLAKDTFKFQKNMYATNLQNQAQDLNRRLESSYRDNDFLTGGNTGYSSLEDYLGKHGFSGELKTLGKKNQRQA